VDATPRRFVTACARALLPPLDPDAWRVWDGETLLAALREAIGARAARPHVQALPSGDRICDLIERGRIPAGTAALDREDIRPHPAPSQTLLAELQAKTPVPASDDRDVITEDEWRRAAEESATRCDAVRDAARVSAEDLMAAARTQRAGAAAGPDGWTGAYLRRLATLFPTEISELIWGPLRDA